MMSLVIFLSLLFFYSLISRSIERTVLTGPSAFTLAGMLVFVAYRGLASIVLGLVYLQQELNLPGEPTIRLALIVTVFLSIFAHGLSASTGICVYARTIAPPDTARPDLPCGKN